MDTREVKQTIHHLIDQIDDPALLASYMRLLEMESRMDQKDPFQTTDEDMVSRAKKSLQSIEEGKSRDLREFKKDVVLWQKKRSI